MRRTAWMAVAVSLMTAGACSSSSSATTGSTTTTRLTVLAAASLSKVFPPIGDAFAAQHPGTSFSFSFGGTDQLVAQIEQGAPADVFAGASKKYGDRLAGEGMVEPWRAFCTNRLVLIVPASNPAGIHALADLARPGIKLVVGAESVPVGSYTRTVLANLDASLGSDYSTKALANVVSNEDSVAGVLTKVQTGEADAGFVYVTDASGAADRVLQLLLPADAQAVATYPIAVVKESTKAAAARQFLDFVVGPTGQSILRAAGFEPPAVP